MIFLFSIKLISNENENLIPSACITDIALKFSLREILYVYDYTYFDKQLNRVNIGLSYTH